MKYSEPSVRPLSSVTKYRRVLSTMAHLENTAMGPPTRIHSASLAVRVMVPPRSLRSLPPEGALASLRRLGAGSRRSPPIRRRVRALARDLRRLGELAVLHHRQQPLRVAQDRQVGQRI